MNCTTTLAAAAAAIAAIVYVLRERDLRLLCNRSYYYLAL